MQDNEGMMLRFYVAEGVRHDGVMLWEWLAADRAEGSACRAEPRCAPSAVSVAGMCCTRAVSSNSLVMKPSSSSSCLTVRPPSACAPKSRPTG